MQLNPQQLYTGIEHVNQCKKPQSARVFPNEAEDSNSIQLYAMHNDTPIRVNLFFNMSKKQNTIKSQKTDQREAQLFLEE